MRTYQALLPQSDDCWARPRISIFFDLTFIKSLLHTGKCQVLYIFTLMSYRETYSSLFFFFQFYTPTLFLFVDDHEPERQNRFLGSEPRMQVVCVSNPPLAGPPEFLYDASGLVS